MANNVKNVHMGVCNITFGAEDFGFTKGGVEVTVKTDTHKVNLDQTGKTTVNEFIMGREVTVKVPLAETTLENLVKVMPGASLVTDTTDSTKKQVIVPVGTGLDLLSFAKPLVLHPVANLAGDKSRDFTLPKAMTPGSVTFAYKLEDEQIFNVEFTGYPNDKGELFYVGDTTAVGA